MPAISAALSDAVCGDHQKIESQAESREQDPGQSPVRRYEHGHERVGGHEDCELAVVRQPIGRPHAEGDLDRQAPEQHGHPLQSGRGQPRHRAAACEAEHDRDDAENHGRDHVVFPSR